MKPILEYATSVNERYGNFDLISYLIQEVITDDCYGLRRLAAMDREVKTILDIGANVGITSSFARSLFPKARIIAIEAFKDTYEALVSNLEGLGIECYNIIFGPGTMLYPVSDGSHSAAVSFREENPQNKWGSLSKSLRDIFLRFKIEEPYIIKMDIEGSEMFLHTDTKAPYLISGSELFALEYHNVKLLEKRINKPEWDQWMLKVLGDNFDIEGLGGDESVTGATYRALRRG